MRIIDARWTPQINWLVIECRDHHFEHRADRWRVTCPKCRAQSDLKVLRARYLKECYQKGVAAGEETPSVDESDEEGDL